MLFFIEFVIFEELNKWLNDICFFNYGIEELVYNCDCVVFYRGWFFKVRIIILEVYIWVSF